MAFTVTQIVDNARDLYNGTGDTFFTDAQIYLWMTNACNILAREALVIETTSTTPSIASTADYAYPTNVIEIKRVTYDDYPLELTTLSEIDSILLSGITTTGTPSYYTDFNNTISLYPTPDAVETIKFYTYSDHAAIVVGTTLAIPSNFQLGLVDYILMNMYSKDKDFTASSLYEKKWEKTLISANRYKRAKKRAGGFAVVKNEEHTR